MLGEASYIYESLCSPYKWIFIITDESNKILLVYLMFILEKMEQLQPNNDPLNELYATQVCSCFIV